MAQNFRNQFQLALPITHSDTGSLLWTGGDFDTLISVRLVNISTSIVTVDVYIRSGTAVTANVNGAVSGSTTVAVDGNVGTIVNEMGMSGTGVDLNNGKAPRVTDASNQASIIVDTVQTIDNDIALSFVNDCYLIKSAPIPAGSSLELMDSGSKIVMKDGDVLYAVASVAGAVDATVSVVDTISS